MSSTKHDFAYVTFQEPLPNNAYHFEHGPEMVKGHNGRPLPNNVKVSVRCDIPPTDTPHFYVSGFTDDMRLPANCDYLDRASFPDDDGSQTDPPPSWTTLCAKGLWHWTNGEYVLFLSRSANDKLVLPRRMVHIDVLRAKPPKVEGHARKLDPRYIDPAKNMALRITPLPVAAFDANFELVTGSISDHSIFDGLDNTGNAKPFKTLKLPWSDLRGARRSGCPCAEPRLRHGRPPVVGGAG